MEARTRDHLTKAARNRDVALTLVDPVLPTTIRPQPLEWAIVAAFYAAVHYVNANLWETRRYEPADHGARRNAVARDRTLRVVHRSYARLRHLAFEVRYHPTVQPTRTDAEDAVHQHLAQVEQTVRSALRHR